MFLYIFRHIGVKGRGLKLEQQKKEWVDINTEFWKVVASGVGDTGRVDTHVVQGKRKVIVMLVLAWLVVTCTLIIKEMN